jgi:hypothetical protein
LRDQQIAGLRHSSARAVLVAEGNLRSRDETGDRWRRFRLMRRQVDAPGAPTRCAGFAAARFTRCATLARWVPRSHTHHLVRRDNRGSTAPRLLYRLPGIPAPGKGALSPAFIRRAWSASYGWLVDQSTGFEAVGPGDSATSSPEATSSRAIEGRVDKVRKGHQYVSCWSQRSHQGIEVVLRSQQASPRGGRRT